MDQISCREQILRRAQTTAIVIAVVCAGLTARLFWLQVVCHGEYQKKALGQHWSKEVLPARRGEIRDRHGALLAISQTGYSCYGDPSRVQEPERAAGELSLVLGIPEAQILSRLSQKDRKFVWLKRRLTAGETERIRSLRMPGICLKKEPCRFYPHGSLAAHVVGFVGIDHHGLEGVEASFCRELSGEDGIAWTLEEGRMTSAGLYSPDAPSRPPVHGATVYLTIDIAFQRILEEELDQIVEKYDPVSAAGVLIEVASGEVLAMSSRPTFDPNSFDKSAPETWRNVAIADAYEMGSVMKPFVVAAALSEHLLAEDTVIFCHNGLYRTAFGRTHRDTHRYGDLTVAEIVIKSSNIGMSIIAQKMGKERVHHYLSRLQFGNKTGISLPGEAKGDFKPLSEWSEYTLTSVPMGHEVCSTAIQMAAAYNVLAGDGVYWPPRIVDKIVYADGKTAYGYPPAAVVRIYPSSIVLSMQKILRRVVEAGTAKQANVRLVSVAGKTGTAQKYDPALHSYSNSRHVAAFAGFAPADKPRFCCVIVVDEPKGASAGGTVSAPSVARVLENVYLLEHWNDPATGS